MDELLKCFKCNCETKPFCSVNGRPCDKCIDICTLVHYQPREILPGTHIKKKCKHSSSASASRKTFPFDTISVGGKGLIVIKTKGNGDCLYESLSKAFGGLLTIEDLRALVSNNQTEAMYDNYMDLSDQNIFGKQLDTIESFAQFRHYIQKCGYDDSCGGSSGNVMWGDENAIQIISNVWLLTFIVFNEKGNIIQRVEPAKTGVCGRGCCPRYVLLRLNGHSPGQEHFDLLQFNGRTLLCEDDWGKFTKLYAS